MHGIVFQELRQFVNGTLGEGGWEKLLQVAEMEGRSFDGIQAYPDSDAVALVTAASETTGQPPGTILEAFGEHIVPGLLGMARPLLKPEWKTLEVLENTEQTIHAVVRLDNEGAQPPVLRASRTGENEITVVYSSERRMCRLAKGICKGLGRHFGQDLSVSETSCMLEGGEVCTLVVSVR